MINWIPEIYISRLSVHTSCVLFYMAGDNFYDVVDVAVYQIPYLAIARAKGKKRWRSRELKKNVSVAVRL